MFSKRIQLICASLFGAFVIQFFTVACSSVEGRAGAETPSSSTCSSWQLQVVSPGQLGYMPISIAGDNNAAQTLTFPTFTAPAGWEPIGAYAATGILLRHCVQ